MLFLIDMPFEYQSYGSHDIMFSSLVVFRHSVYVISFSGILIVIDIYWESTGDVDYLANNTFYLTHIYNTWFTFDTICGQILVF